MKCTILFGLVFWSVTVSGQATQSYNKHLADSLHADDYGMKKYVLVILKTGSTKNVTKQLQDSLFAGHMKNIQRLAKEGRLVAAGPMQENEKHYEGIFILNAATIAEADALLITDPAVKAHLLDTERYVWYGSAALPLYLKYHDSIQKKHF